VAVDVTTSNLGVPVADGEIVTSPRRSEWPTLVARNRSRAAAWDFRVAGLPVALMRVAARQEMLAAGAGFSARLGVPVSAPGEADEPIVATGHQPDLYHPGVWVKDFLLDQVAREVGATGVDIVVDTDGFDAVAITTPCLKPNIQRCTTLLARGSATACYALTPVPDAEELDAACAAVSEALSTLGDSAVVSVFSAFCEELRGAASDAENLAELVTFARRRFEARAGTGYLEVPITEFARSEPFARFLVDMALDAERFCSAYNTELEHYRALTKTRSAAQPFPNLGADAHSRELPLWHVGSQHRDSVWAEEGSGGAVRLVAGGRTIVELPREPDRAVEALRSSGALIAPKALALTLYVRMFTCDLFIHGTGGGRYDRVTDGVIRRYFGVEPPAFVVATATMHLPHSAELVREEDVSAAKERLNRLEHNPDVLLGEVEFSSEGEREAALELAAEKKALVTAIGQPDADRKAIGIRIREVNTELAGALEPLKRQYQAELSALEEGLTASDVLTDRTYPFCFWDPAMIAEQVR